jgi:K+-transporting ATPase ATPase C chain
MAKLETKVGKQIRPALLVLLLFILVTGILYPLAVTGLAQLFFPFHANGSLIEVGGQVVGSELIGQAFNDAKYFWSRPSAIEYNPMPSSGSNLGPTSQELQEQVQQREQDLRSLYELPADASLPPDLLFASGSGLDPHISPAAARLQIPRVAQARGMTNEQVANLVEQSIETAQLGLLGEPRVNVFLLNLALDTLK